MKLNLRNLFMSCLIFSMSLTMFAEPVVITVESAGTLSTKITEAEKFTITDLKIIGPLSNSDIFLIREMAGRGSKEGATDGKLIFLDLSEASIVSNDADGVYFDQDYNEQRTKDNEIGNLMFSKLKLQTIVLPSNIVEIKDYAFTESEIQSIEIPANVTKAGNYLFSKCLQLTNINLGNITAITDNMFEDCKELKEINIPKGVKSIGNTSFNNCTALTKVTMPETMGSIGFWAFKGTALSELHAQSAIPPAAGWGALEGINKKTCVLYVPKGAVDTYRSNPDWNFTQILEEDIVPDDKPVTQLSVTLEKAGTLSDLIAEKDKWTIENLTISGPLNGKDLAFIREMAGINFSWEKTQGKLTHLDMTNTTLVYEGSYDDYGIRVPVETDYYAYVEASLNTPDPLRMAARQDALPEMVFTKTKLEEVIMPKSIKKIYSSFSECYNLKGTVVIPEGVTTIGDWAFQGCSLIEEVVFPSTLIESTSSRPASNENAICSHAFDGCSSLKAINIPACVTTLRDATFLNCTSLTSLYLPANLTSIGQMAFGGCTGLATIEVESEKPALAYYQAFDKINKETCILIVPSGSRPAYKSAKEWCDFINILEKGSEKIFTIHIDNASRIEATFGPDAQPLPLKDGKNIVPIESFSNPLSIKAVESCDMSMTLNGKAIEEETIQMGIGDILDIVTVQLATVTFETNSEKGMDHVRVSYNQQEIDFTDAPYTVSVPINTILILSPEKSYKLTDVSISDGTQSEVLPTGEYKIPVKTDITVSFEVEKEGSGIESTIADDFLYDSKAGLLYAKGSIAIYTATGNLVDNYQHTPVSTSSFPAGLYIVKGLDKTFKFVK